MRLGHQILSLWFVFGVHTRAHAVSLPTTLARGCEAALVKVGLRAPRTPTAVLNKADRAELVEIATNASSPADAYDQMIRVWQGARLRVFSEDERRYLRNVEHMLRQASLIGVREDTILPTMTAGSEIGKSLIGVVDYIHELERLILSAESSGRLGDWVVSVAPFSERQMDQIFRAFALSGEHEFLHALPSTVLRIEAARIKSLQVRGHRRRLALAMLRRGEGSRRFYASLHEANWFGPGFRRGWRLAVNPAATGEEADRAMVASLIHFWRQIDNRGSASQEWLTSPKGAALSQEQIAARAAEMRRRAITEEWDLLHTFGEDTRRQAVALVKVSPGFSPAYRRRLIDALTLSSLLREDYVSHRRIVTRAQRAPWTE